MFEEAIPSYVQYGVLVLLIGFATFEWQWSRRQARPIYSGKETAANFAILLGNRVSKALFIAYTGVLYGLGTEHSLFTVERSRLVFLATFFAVDLVYYFYHRLMHEVRLFWCIHLVHHSSLLMNLTTSFRLNWLSPVLAPFVYMPLVLLGLPAEFVLASSSLNLLYQYFLHTEAIRRVPFVEGIFNTPSAHRVHHASNERYLDKNYGGVLMIWDRIFGTYAVEEGELVYGVTTGFQGYNPAWLVFGGFVDLARGRKSKG